jgi:hypothetical protein
MTYRIRILCDVTLPDRVLRVWDGSGGVFIDDEGNVYKCAQFSEDALQQIEAAINGEAFTLSLSLIDLPSYAGDDVWEYDEANPVSGSPFVIKLQTVDEEQQPIGEPEVVFTGTIDNLSVADQASADGITSVVTVEVTNRFVLRNITNGAVLSDVDQRARAKILNPSAADDESCERVPILRDKTIRWPNW